MLKLLQQAWQRCRQNSLRAGHQAKKNAIEQAHEPKQHPDGDGQRQPHQQAGQQVFFKWHKCFRWNVSAVTGATRAATARCGRRRCWLGFGGCRIRGYLCSGRRCCSRSPTHSGRCRGATLEISRVPARSLELEPGCRELLGKRSRLAVRAFGQNRIRHFLQNVLGESTGAAFVGVDGHGVWTFGVIAKLLIIKSPQALPRIGCGHCAPVYQSEHTHPNQNLHGNQT